MFGFSVIGFLLRLAASKGLLRNASTMIPRLSRCSALVGALFLFALAPKAHPQPAANPASPETAASSSVTSADAASMNAATASSSAAGNAATSSSSVTEPADSSATAPASTETTTAETTSATATTEPTTAEPTTTTEPPATAESATAESAPIEYSKSGGRLTADSVRYEGGTIIAESHSAQGVVFQTTDTRVQADRIELDTVKRLLRATGKVVVERQRSTVRKPLVA